jgi:hypothetical protein
LQLSLRILITVLARHCSSSTPTEKDIDLSISYENNFLGAKTAQESAELKAFYATLLLYLTRRKKPLSLPALRCFVYQQAGLDVLTAFDKE